ncbi:EamA family transporter RarD [Bacillus sp. V33-4]|uniref:EamA family transporter RarD n=1 Tax=Bacillus sp. V33-4 TaxID=2054169 RepID=UPI000C776155|nr:EamA family transporter RarD [Bacillus sp. V33-4]PLR83796.1 EamA family transporter RarD [Bacillus sp. V33-4]
MNHDEQRLGAIYAGFSYILWGLLPIYWKFLHHVSAYEILASRIVWSFIFMLAVLFVLRKQKAFLQQLKELKNIRKAAALACASLLISINWFIYIWAVHTDQMIQASLGYYINPLVSVLLGMLVFKEKLSPAQYLSVLFAAIGVLVLTISYGSFPWIALTLAVSFGLYGLSKKLIKVDSEIGLTLETLMVTPIAAIYIGVLFYNGGNAFASVSISTDLLLIGAGAATALPLLFFAKGAQRIPLSMLGFLQYIAPTLTLLLGVFVYGEHFSRNHLLAFTFIWAALTIYSIARTKAVTALELKWKKSKGLEM